MTLEVIGVVGRLESDKDGGSDERDSNQRVRAKEGKADALRTFLTRIIPTIASSTGCLFCQLLQSHENPTRLVVIEVWDSIGSHQASMRDIPPEEFTEVMELLDGTPVGEYYHE